MSMDFESFKKAWQERTFEGYLFERPTPVPDIRDKSRSIERKLLVQDISQIAGTLLSFAVLAWAYVSIPLTLARVSLGVLAGYLCWTMAALVRLRLQHRTKDYDLPKKQFLIAERDKIQARIRLVRLSATWYSLPAYVGLTLFSVAFDRSIWGLLPPIAFAAFMMSFVYGQVTRRIRRHLLPHLEDVKRRLREYEMIDTEQDNGSAGKG